MSALPRGSFSNSVCASAGSVTFIRKTAPDPSILANHWSILPASIRRIVSYASDGMTGGMVWGVALAVHVPIASTLVVRVLAAAISAEPGGVLFSDIFIKAFAVWVI